MPRALITSRWARWLAGSLLCGVVAAILAAAARDHWGARKVFGNAEAAWDRGELPESRPLLFREVAERHPDHRLAPEALFRLGRGTYLFLDDPREAVVVLRALARREECRGLGAAGAEAARGNLRGAPGGLPPGNRGVPADDRPRRARPRATTRRSSPSRVARSRSGITTRRAPSTSCSLERYPESDLKPRALAGIANAWYVTGRFGQAVELYHQAQREARDPALAAEAGFGVATSLEEAGDLGRRARAVRTRAVGLPEPRPGRAADRPRPRAHRPAGGHAVPSRNERE